jgi:predicted dehydrogenase
MTGFRTIPDDGPLRLAVVGAGRMGRAWLRTIRSTPQVALVAVVDVAPGAAQAALDEAGIHGVRAFPTLADAAASAGPQAVVDATVPAAHLPVTLEALGLGLPVLGEKPAAATLPEAIALAEAAERAGELFMVSQNRRYDRNLAGLRRRLPEIGPIGLVTTQFFRAVHFGGFREEMAHPVLVDAAIHSFDTARMLLGTEPLTVHCEEFNPPWSWYAGAGCVSASFEFPGGARYLYQGSWASPGRQTSWNGEWRLDGEHGGAEWDGDHPAQLFLGEAGDRVERCEPVDAPEDIAGTLDEFVRALRTGATPSGAIRDNIRSLAMVHAAVDSARDGRLVAIGEVLARCWWPRS